MRKVRAYRFRFFIFRENREKGEVVQSIKLEPLSQKLI